MKVQIVSSFFGFCSFSNTYPNFTMLVAFTNVEDMMAKEMLQTIILGIL